MKKVFFTQRVEVIESYNERRDCADQNIPIYGFCRGMQFILNYFNCPLEKVTGHVAVKHMIVGYKVNRMVNSYHNFACLDEAICKKNGILVTSKSEEGVIESIVVNDLPIIGTMWHPERNTPFEKEDKEMVKNLFA